MNTLNRDYTSFCAIDERIRGIAVETAIEYINDHLGGEH